MNYFLQKKRQNFIDVTPLFLGLLKKGAFFISRTEKTRHSNTDGYLKGLKKNSFVFDLRQVIDDFQRVLRVLYYTHSAHLILGSKKKFKFTAAKKILFIGAPNTVQELFIELCKSKNHFFISEEDWVKGLLTNNVNTCDYKRDFLKNLKSKSVKEKQFFYQKFGGILKLQMLPDLIVIFNHSQSERPLIESKKMNIPIIAILPLYSNPFEIDYPIFANFKSSLSSAFFYKSIKKALKVSVWV